MTEKIYTGDDYEEAFDIDYCLKTTYKDEKSKPASIFHYGWLDKLAKQGNIGGKRLLEIGTGPMVQSLASIVNYYDDIILSDYTEKHRTWLKNWWNGSYSELMAPLIRQILEIEDSRQSVKEREAIMRRNVSAIISSDIRIENPLAPCIFKPFDAVIMKYIFDGAVRGEEEYATAVKNISNVLRPGGLIMVMGTACDTYIAKVTFQGCNVSFDAIRKVWKDSSEFELLDFKSDVIKAFWEGFSVYNVLARKRKL